MPVGHRALIGIGAANMAVYRLLRAEGVAASAFIACDSRGTLHTGRSDIEARQQELIEKWSLYARKQTRSASTGVFRKSWLARMSASRFRRRAQM
jgi:malic enzyme